MRHTLSLGMFRTYAYDAAGNRTLESDFEGLLTERDYDLLGRVVERRGPSEAPVSFTYTDDGLRETVTDARGATTYQYDARRRLTRVDHPDGSPENWTDQRASSFSGSRAHCPCRSAATWPPHGRQVEPEPFR